MRTTNEEPMITQTRIISEYGWTKNLISKFLPEPVLVKNPHYRSSAPMKLWKLSRVTEIMETEEFKAAMEKCKKRKDAAGKAVSTKRKKVEDAVTSYINAIQVSVLPDDELVEKTLKAKQDWYDRHQDPEDYGQENYRIARTADREIVERWVVNYIRHNLVSYDLFLSRISGQVGSVAAYPEVKEAVLKKIAEAYPAYKMECDRQRGDLEIEMMNREREKDMKNGGFPFTQFKWECKEEIKEYGHYYKKVKGYGQIPMKITVIAINGEMVTYVYGHSSKKDLEDEEGVSYKGMEMRCKKDKIIINVSASQKRMIEKEERELAEAQQVIWDLKDGAYL